MEPKERAEALIQKMSEEFLVGGQMKKWLVNNITKAIEIAIQEEREVTKHVKSKTNF